jgi:rhodanese-related sulfurtransferase
MLLYWDNSKLYCTNPDCGAHWFNCFVYPNGYNELGRFASFYLTTHMTIDSTKAGAIIIDVRSPVEYASGHVEGSVNMPLDSFVNTYAKVIRDKESQVVVYCASGARSGQAVQYLKSQGYANVVNGISCHQVASRLGKSVV